MMETVLCFLKSIIDSWLSFSSDIFELDPNSRVFLGLVLFLFLGYLLFSWFLPKLWRWGALPKRPNRVLKRKKGKRIKGHRTHLRKAKEAEEGRRLLSVIKSPLDRHPDTARLRQLLCPDPLCEVCNRTTAKVSRLLSRASLEDADDSVSHSIVTSVTELSSFLSSDISEILPGDVTPTPEPEPVPPSPPALPPKQATPLADLRPLSPGDSLPPEGAPQEESRFPVGYLPPPPPAHPPPSPRRSGSREAESGVQPRAASPLMERSSPGALPTEVAAERGLEGAGPAGPAFSPKQPRAEHLSPPKLAHTASPQELPVPPSSEASFKGNTSDSCVGPRDLFFLSPDVLTLLESQVRKKGNFLMNKKEKNMESFPKPLKPVDSAERMLESVADHQDSGEGKGLLNSKVKREGSQVHQQVPDPETPGDQLQQKYIQHFWGLPSLHSESLDSITPVSADRSSSQVCFNPKSSASTTYESQLLPCSSPLPLSKISPQPVPQTLPESQTQCSPDQPESQIESSPPELLPSPPYKIGTCGVRFHGSQNEVPFLSESETFNVEYNILQKEQGVVWGLPNAVKKSKEDFCLQAPELLLVSHSSKSQLPISILVGDYPLSDKLREKFEHHLRKRLIQHRWGLPRRIHESLSLMRPQTDDTPERSEPKSSHGLSWISLYKCQSFEDICEFDLGQSRSLEKLSQEEGVGKKEKHRPAPGTKAGLCRCSEKAGDSDSETNSEGSLEDLSVKNSMSLKMSLNQLQLTDNLELHLNKKFGEISENQIPSGVARSWSSLLALPILEKGPCSGECTELDPLVGRDNRLDTSQDISFLCPQTQKLMEDHINTFHLRMKHGFPQKVQESIQIFRFRESLFRESSSHSSLSSLISGQGSKPLGVSKPLRNVNPPPGEQKGMTDAVPVVDLPVSKEGQKAPEPPSFHTSHKLTRNIQKPRDARQASLPASTSILDKMIQKRTVAANRHTVNLPTRPDGVRPELKDEGMSSGNTTEGLQREMAKDLEHSPVSNKHREMSEVEKPKAPPSVFNNSGKSQVTDVNSHKVKAALTAERPQARRSPQDLVSADLKRQLINELKFKVEGRRYRQAPDLPRGMPLAGDNLINKNPVTPDKHVSGRDMEASQVHHIHFDSGGIHLEQGQSAWVPAHASCKYQDKNFLPEAKRECPPTPKKAELGGGDAGLGICPPRRESCHPQDRTFQEASGSKSALLPKGQLAPDNLRNKMKHFMQWLCPRIKHKRQESALEKGRAPSSSVQGGGLHAMRAASAAQNTGAQKFTRDTGTFPGEKVGRRDAGEVTCPQKPVSSPLKTGKSWCQAEPVHRHAFNSKASSSQVLSTKAQSQEADPAGQTYPIKNSWIKDIDRQSQKGVAQQRKLLCQRHPPSMPKRESMPQPRHTCKCRVVQVPPSGPTFAEGTVLGNLSLLFKQKSLLQKFGG